MLFGKDLDTRAVEAKHSPAEREKFISSQKQTILKIAAGSAHKYVTVSDDEWSVALYAFSKAIDSYSPDKGKFMAHAGALIRQDMIDSYRTQKKYEPEVLTGPESFEGTFDEDASDPVQYEVIRESVRAADSSLADEIASLGQEIRAYGFSFMDLTEASPKQDRTRRDCLTAAVYLKDDPVLYGKMRKLKILAVTELAAGSGVSKKIIDKFRKFIITSAIVLAEDYPMIAEYLNIRKGGSVHEGSSYGS